MDTFITQNSVQNPYKEFDETISPFDIVTIYYDFNYFRLLNSDAPDGGLKIKFGSSGDETDFKAGLGFSTKTAMQRVTIRNTTASTINLNFAMAIGSIDDSRSTNVGNTPVVNASGNVLSTNDATANSYLLNIRKTLNEESGFESLNKLPKLNLAGATLYTAVNSTTLICSAAANINGVIIRRYVSMTHGSRYAGLRIDDEDIDNFVSSSFIVSQLHENVLIPAGKKVELKSSNAEYSIRAYAVIL